MPQLAAADAFLILEFIAGNRRIPHGILAALLAFLPPSFSPRTSPRLRKALVLRALHAALHAEDASSSFTLLGKARRVLADPNAAACFPNQLSFADSQEDHGARAAAAVGDLKRFLDHEWANLPPSMLELAADRLAGHRSLQTWAASDHANRTKLRLLGESTEREILAKLMQDAPASNPPIPPEVPDIAKDANDADGAQRNNAAYPSNQSNEADRAQGGIAEHQNVSIKGAQRVQLPEKSVPASNKRNLVERHPNASTYEWDGLGDSDDDRPVGKRELPPFERKPHPSPACAHRMRKKWSEIEEKTLLEGVVKYGRGNWKDIKMAYPDVFEERSTVDLKDKFRNMERHHESA
ncbi:uncharacterized protein LOC112881664 isoform X2 [Panicum hallii]|uniref:uncharacterized protein LOC112881664 isoform X2 n=1 Tax=Panicum hallii TaxID=206008 RepID=UPI000DF4DB47|nr:uncharacterized protein LOC112881664 isoform X2 [Panicum hallii]